MGMVNRAFLLSNLKFHKKDIELIINILLHNDYPVNLFLRLLTPA